jgi:hypothetical protein
MTLGTTSCAIGSTYTTIGGFTSVSSDTFVGNLTGTAQYAGQATNIAGGGIGYIPVQSGVNATYWIAPGPSGYVLTSNGTGNAPTWQVGGGVAESLTGTALAAGITGSSLSSVGTITSGTWHGATVAANFGGTGYSTYGVGDILYANGTTTLGKLSLGIEGDILMVQSGFPVWVTAGANNNAGNIVGGAAGSLPYQGAVNSTSFLGIGSPGQILTVNGASLPAWQNPTSSITSVVGTTNQVTVLTIGSTSTISLPSNITISGTLTAGSINGTVSNTTSLNGGAVGYIPYQTATDATSFIAPGTAGYVLTSNGAGFAPSWQVASGGSSGVTIGSTAISGGGSTTSLAGLASVSSTAFIGTLSTAAQTNITSVGTLNSLAVTGAITQNNGLAVGYLGVPQNAQGNYTCVIGDAGKHLFTAASSITWTIPSNATVAFPIGTVISFINQSAGTCTIVCGDTMYLVAAGTTGSRTLNAWSMATVIKTTATTWIISGNTVT